MISRSFIKSSFIYTAAGTLPVASAFILLPFYLLYLSTETFGAFSIFLAFSVLVQLLVTFSYDATLYIHYHEYKDDRTRLARYAGSALTVIATLGILLALFFWASGEWLAGLLFSGKELSFYPYGYVCVGIGIFQAFFKVHNNLLQTRQLPEIFFGANLLSFSLIAGLTVAGLHLYPDSLFGPLGGRLCAAVVSGGWAAARMVREFGIRFDLSFLRPSLSFNFYTLVYQLQQWVMNYFDRVLVAFFLPMSQVGVYAFAVQCVLVVEFVMNGLFASFYPKVVGMVMDQEEKKSTLEVNRYYYGLTAVQLVMVTGIIFAFPLVLLWFLSEGEYLNAIPLIPFVALLYIFKPMRMYFSIPYGILKYTKPLPGIYLVVTAVKVGAMFLLIGGMGVYGVILAGLLSQWLEIILLYRRGRAMFSYGFNSFKLIGLPTAVALLIAVAEPLWGDAAPHWLHAGYGVACLALLLWVYRREIRFVLPDALVKKT